MGRFFASQKLDEAGVVGIALQKLLVFFMVIDAVSYFCGFYLFSPVTSFLFHLIVFVGAYKRRTAVLLIYVVYKIISLMLAFVAVFSIVSSVMCNEVVYESGSSSDATIPVPSPRNFRTVFDLAKANSTHPTHHNIPSFSSASSSSSSDASGEQAMDQSVVLIGVMVFIIAVFVLYCKILSIVLAHRMRKLLLVPAVLPTSQPIEEKQQIETEPTFIPADYENNFPIFTQPGFAYQPMVPGQSPMMPPPFMYGQHPVFYTYGPPSSTTSDEKQ